MHDAQWWEPIYLLFQDREHIDRPRYMAITWGHRADPVRVGIGQTLCGCAGLDSGFEKLAPALQGGADAGGVEDGVGVQEAYPPCQ